MKPTGFNWVRLLTILSLMAAVLLTAGGMDVQAQGNAEAQATA